MKIFSITVNFYPRSPCGERQKPYQQTRHCYNFYPRSPCGERRFLSDLHLGGCKISIHALLAESDKIFLGGALASPNFYPRSPCGERPRFFWAARLPVLISIHALLAESDAANPFLQMTTLQFLSTLSLRRATHYSNTTSQHVAFLSTLSLRRATGFMPYGAGLLRYFYPRSPCGERHVMDNS